MRIVMSARPEFEWGCIRAAMIGHQQYPGLGILSIMLQGMTT